MWSCSYFIHYYLLIPATFKQTSFHFFFVVSFFFKSTRCSLWLATNFCRYRLGLFGVSGEISLLIDPLHG